MAYQNDVDAITDQLQRGLISAAEANVLLVQCAGVKLIAGRVPQEVRKALNAAVKEGRLGHLKKDGHKPEAYFHVNSKTKAKEARNRAERRVFESLAGVMVNHRDLTT